MTETENGIYARLAKVQHELKVGKDDWNDFSKYKYRNAETILTALKPILYEQHLTLNMSESIELIGDRYYVKATVQVTDGKDFVEASAYAREEETKKGMDVAQITGSASSYARKYALGGLFAIDDGKDADSMDNRDTKPKQAYSKPAPKATAPKADTTTSPAITTVYTAQQRDEIHTLAGMLGYNNQVIEMKLETINTPEDAETMITNLKQLVGNKDEANKDN